ncbi:MAG: BTAD domain-containing putative transcriptional regulator [Mycobacterium leprae]
MREPLGIFVNRLWSSRPIVVLDEALAHGDYLNAVAELIRLGGRIMDGEENVPTSRLTLWLDRIPPEWNGMLTPLRSFILFQSRSLTQVEITLDGLLAELQAGSAMMQPETDWLLPLSAFRGDICAAMGRLVEAQAAFGEARRLLAGHQPGQLAQALSVPPQEAERLMRLDRAGRTGLVLDALAYYQTVGYTAGTARVSHNLAHQYLDMGEPAPARYWLERTLELRQGQPGLLPRAFTLDSLGVCYRQLGLLQEAETALDECLRLGTLVESGLVQAYGLVHLGDVYRDQGEPATAQELYRNALAMMGELRDGYGMAECHLSLSVLYRRQGQFGLAADAAAEAIALAHGYGDPRYVETLHLHEQVARLLMGDESAARGLQDLVQQFAQAHAPGDEVLGRWYLAFAALSAGNGAAVFAEAQTALTLAGQYRHLHLLAGELPVSAGICRGAVEHGVSPELLAGLIKRATPTGLAQLLERVPEVAAIVKAAGRLGEARALSVRLLGTFRVTQGGRDVDLSAARSQKVISLFKLLVSSRGKPLLREQIVDAIWPEADPEAADRSFEVTVSTLRKLLDPLLDQPLILRRGRGYLFNPAVTLSVDMEEFTAHLSRGQWWWERGQTAPAVSEWHAAERLYAGDFLAEDPYDDWATATRERLKEQYVDLVTHLGELDFQNGHYTEALQRATTVLAEDPIRERAFRLLLRTHAAQGNRWVALRAYRRFQAELARELGEEPTPETQELARRIHDEG